VNLTIHPPNHPIPLLAHGRLDEEMEDDMKFGMGEYHRGAPYDDAGCIPMYSEEEKMLQYLNRAGVMRTMSSLMKELLITRPSDDTECRLVLLQWLVSRLSREQLGSYGIIVDFFDETDESDSSDDYGLEDEENRTRREELLHRLEQRYIEEYELKKTIREVGITDEEFESFRLAFSSFDSEGTGRLTLSEIKLVAKQCGFDPSRKKLNLAFEQLDRENNGYLELPEFLRMMKLLDPAYEWNAARSMGFSREEFENRRQQFLEVDEDNSGELNVKELLGLMRMMGYSPSAKAVHITFRSLDKDKSGKLDFIEFLDLIKKVDPQEEQKAIAKFNFTAEETKAFKNEFAKLDVDDNAILSGNEILRLLMILGQSCTAEQHRDILAKVDKDNSGTVDYIEFLHYQYSLRSKLLKEKYDREEKRRKRTNFKKRKFTAEELCELQERFNDYDTDRSGGLEMAEISFLLRDLGLEPKTADDQKRLAKLLNRVGFNGALEFTEFTLLLQSIREELETEQEEKDMVLAKSLGFTDQEEDDFYEVFKNYDTSGDGKLNKEETRLLLSSLAMDIPHKLFDDTYEALDSDGSGLLEFGEFLTMMKTLTDIYNSGASKDKLAKSFASAAAKTRSEV